MILYFALALLAVTNWPMFGYNASHSSYNSNERTISTSDVSHLRERWRLALGDVADSTPIFLSGVAIKGRTRSMLFQTAKDGTTYGIDARSGHIEWHFLTHGPNITTSTPAADVSHELLYVPGVDGFVHELEAATGTEIRGHGFPVRITRMPETEKDASPLTLANGYLYVATSGYFGDAPPYIGHVVSVHLSDGVVRVFNSLCADGRSLPTSTSCSASGSGIWSRAGVVVDPDPALNGRIYVATGNGDFNAARGGHNYGDSVLALSPEGAQLLQYYTPPDYSQLDASDADLGSTAPAMLPSQPQSRTPTMAVQGGKDGILRLLDRTQLVGVGGELQRIDIGGALFSAPAVWASPRETWIYLGLSSSVRAYRVITDTQGVSRLSIAWVARAGQTVEGTSPVVSNDIVFIAMSSAIYALDARTGHELWNSRRASAGGSIGAIHWQSPIVVDGSVYCSDENGYLTAYSLP